METPEFNMVDMVEQKRPMAIFVMTFQNWGLENISIKCFATFVSIIPEVEENRANDRHDYGVPAIHQSVG